jgi:hypothetical protein
MVVAVIAMRVMKMPADDVIEVIPVRRSLVAALRSVSVLLVVSFATVVGRAVVWVSAANGNGVLINVTAMNVMQMAVVEIVRVSVVAYGHVPATGLVHVIMLGVLRALTFFHTSPFEIEADSNDAYDFRPTSNARLSVFLLSGSH